MPKYTISVPEVFRRTIVVEAESFDEACRSVTIGEADYLDTGDAAFSSAIEPGDAEWILLKEEP